MKQIRKILQLRLQDGTASVRFIAHATGTSRPVAKDYLDHLDAHPLSLDQLQNLSDEALRSHLELDTPAVQETEVNRALIAWLKLNIKRLGERHITRRILHEEYRKVHPEGLQYSQFCLVLHRQYQHAEVSGLLEHKAGDKLYIDFTGQKAVWRGPGGQEHSEEIFLGVLGASGALFSLPVPSQKQQDLVHAVEQAFLSFGGVPRAVVPDCLKSAVLSHDGYESVTTPLFFLLMEHYSTLSLPARPRHPKDKALVEGAVNLVYRQILARLKDQVFDDRGAFLSWWSQQVNRINQTPFQKLPGSRQSRLEEIDRPALKPLAPEPFGVQTVLQQTVESSGAIYIPADKTYYSVPYSLQGNKVEIHIHSDRLEVWHQNERKATHDRQPEAGKVLRPEHLAPAQRWYASRNPEELIRTLALQGLHVATWARQVLVQSGHEDEAWQRLEGLRKLAKKVPQRLDTVCRIALKQELWRLQDLRRILKAEEDLVLVRTEQLTPELDLEDPVPVHENIRGAGYYVPQGVGA